MMTGWLLEEVVENDIWYLLVKMKENIINNLFQRILSPAIITKN